MSRCLQEERLIGALGLSYLCSLDMGGGLGSKFRPCIDLHNGQVKQIVGGTLSEVNPNTLKTNFVARHVFFD